MPDLGPWEPLDRPPVWVLHEGQWARGYLLAWIPPPPGGEWHGVARWVTPEYLQHEVDVPARWLAPGAEPAPEVPAGEVGFVPPPRFGQPPHRGPTHGTVDSRRPPDART